jgi:aminopeptidase N
MMLNKIVLPCIVIFILLSTSIYSQGELNDSLNINTRNYDQDHVKLNLKFNFDKQEVYGIEDFTFYPLINNFEKLTLHSRTTKVSEVTLNGKNLNFSQNEKHLYITLDKPYKIGDKITVTIKYTSDPTTGMFFFEPTKKNPEIPYEIWTQGEGDFNRFWYPAYDLPDDKLTSEILATIPDTLIAISNGVLKSVIENPSDSTKTFDWEMDQLHSNYLNTLIVGDYQTVKENDRGIELDYNVPKKWADKTDYFYGQSADMMNFYSDYLIPYPYERYAQTTVQDFSWGGMENITSATLNRRLLHDQTAEPNYSSEELIAHEMAHQWFGDYVTCKTWAHIWLNEGFATYMTDLWIEHKYGEDRFRFRRYNENNKYFDNELKAEPLDSVKLDTLNEIPVELEGDKAYERGAAVLNMLRFYLGDKAFEKGLRNYLETNGSKAVETKDFEKAMSEASGRNLTQFFREWIYGAGFPVFNINYYWDQNNKKLELKVYQMQEMLPAVGLFHVPVLVEITTRDGVKLDTISITRREQTFKLDCSDKPYMVRFNKNDWILCRVNVTKSFDEWAYQMMYDNDVVGRIVAAKELANFGLRAIPYLKQVLIRDKFYGVRIQAVKSLKEIGGDDVFDPLVLATQDFDARVRVAAIKALTIFNADKVSSILMDKIKNEKNVYVIGAAYYAIGKVKMDSAFDILSSGLKLDSHRNIIRREIFDGMKALDDSSVLPLVKKYIQYKYSYGGMHLLDTAALNCAMLFSKTNRGEVINIVCSALMNPYFRTRNYAANLLVKLNATDKISLLKEVLSSERRLDITTILQGAIKKLEKTD